MEVVFNLRTDQQLIDDLKEIAEEEGRSANKQLERILREAIDAWKRESGRTK